MLGLAVRFLPYALAFFSSLCIMTLELVAARLVARHVGSSLYVWTSVIGIILGGICLGNFLGGRLADRTEPRRAVGGLLALGAFLSLVSLWVNSVVGLTPGLSSMPWGLRTVVVVSLNFLVPATVLGMIGPVVAKIAVEQARKTGSALGDVYFWGAVGSIVGTFLTGFFLLDVAPLSTIVIVVASGLALLAVLMLDSVLGKIVAGLTTITLGAGSAWAVIRGPETPMLWNAIPINPALVVGYALMLLVAAFGAIRLNKARLPRELGPDPLQEDDQRPAIRLWDLALLAFLISLAFMSLEMVAGRLVTRHLGSSIYGWTSVIGVMLGGLSLGNLLGGKLADRITEERHSSWLFLAASVMTLYVLMMESPPRFLSNWLDGEPALLSYAISGELTLSLPWSLRVLLVVSIAFFLPAVSMGTVSPVMAKLAVDRLRRDKRTGTAIGQIYAWGMVGSIVGTFLTSFVLIDLIGTKGLILALATVLALAATMLGTVSHAIWAGIPLGLSVIAFVPITWFEAQGLSWGVREPKGDPEIEDYGLAHVNESNYYFIKVTNNPEGGGRHRRDLILDSLIHGYYVLGHPEHIEYDYEYIYAQVTWRVAQAKAEALGLEDPREVPLRALFLGGGSYTFPRYLQHVFPNAECVVSEIDPAVTEANHIALDLPRDTPIETHWGDARQFVHSYDGEPFDLVFGDAFNDFSVPWHLTTREFNDRLAGLLTDDGVYMINIIDVYRSDRRAEERAEEKLYEKAAGAEVAPRTLKAARSQGVDEAQRLGGFLGAWINTADLTFPNIYVFGTDTVPGYGLRETFVVVAAKAPIEMEELGVREGDPRFEQDYENFEPVPYHQEHMEALHLRSRGIVLTDDYAPVDNLLAPVAATRGEN
ncbi:hypothetical protein BH23PLA1_BH23PLA1_37340 [soil metagenome]